MNDSRLELVVRGGRVVTPQGIQRLDFGVSLGRIVTIAPRIDEAADRTLDLKGSHVFPGIIDSQVHFHDPGREDCEGFASGSAALAAGGGTSFFAVPQDSEPPVLDAAALRAKRALAEEKSCTDFALWGGLSAGNLDQLAGLRDAGAIGLMAFLGPPGGAGVPRVDARILREGMKRAVRLGLPVAVHTGEGSTAAPPAAVRAAPGRRASRSSNASRSVETELAAIRLAIELAGETGCALHLVPVSCPEAFALVTDARDQRVDVTAGTCPHYLLLNEQDADRLGGGAPCAPPLREEKRRAGLWQELREGRIQTIASDHSPEGVAGCQHGFELLFSEAGGTLDRDLPLLADVLAHRVARRFRLDAHKGSMAVGQDADFCVLTAAAEREITARELWTRHPASAYLGRRSRLRITHTVIRGQTAWSDQRPASPAPRGRFLRPA